TGAATMTLESCGTYTELGATVSDCETGLSVTIGGDTVDMSTPGVYTVTYNVTDTAGNVATEVTRTVTVEDTTNPTFTAPGNTTIYTTSSNTYDASIGITGDVSDEADNCSAGLEATYTDVVTNGACSGSKIITRTWRLEDASGNVTTHNQVITVSDNIPPTVTAPTTVDLECGTDIPAAAVNITAFNLIAGASASDNSTIVAGLSVSSITGALIGDNCNGTITRTYTITDDCGNATSIDQVFTITDNTVPTFTRPADITINKTSNCTYDAGVGFTVDVTNETDNCSSGLNATYADVINNINPGSTTITRTWSLVDNCGNAAADQVQTITVLDNIAPEANCQNITVAVDEVFTPAMINNNSTDNCGIETYSLSKTSFNCSEVGDHTVTLKVTDYNGNTDTCDAVVTVNPTVVNGGDITGHNYFSNGDSDGPEADIINVTACPENEIKNALLTLSGNDGIVNRWEYSYNSGATWYLTENNPTQFSYVDATTKTAIRYTDIVKTTIFRVRLDVGSCVGYSAGALVNVIPPDVVPSVDFDTAHICIGEVINVAATSEYANNILLDEGGLFNQANPEDWILNGVPGVKFPANADNGEPNIWAETNGPKTLSGITYDTSDNTKFAIAYGNPYGIKTGPGNTTWYETYTTMETPIFNSVGLEELFLVFDQAYYLEAGAFIKIEISVDGGVTYPPEINPLDPGYNSVTDAAHNYTGPSTSGAGTHNGGFVHTLIDLNGYIGQSNLRVKFTFESGGTTNSAWAIDNISVPDRHVDEVIEWTDEFGNVINYGFTASITPVTPGYQHIGATSLIDQCRSVDDIGTQRIEVYVDYAYAGSDLVSNTVAGECGETSVILNAYDNAKTSNENKFEGAWDYSSVFTATDTPGSVYAGMSGTFEGTWTAVSNTDCTGVSSLLDVEFSDIHDPKSTFTGEAGNYTLTWTAVRTYTDTNGNQAQKVCSDDVNVTITNCSGINFDGDNDYVDFKNTNYNLTNQPFSIESWVKSNQENSNIQTIFSKRDANNLGASGYDLRLVNNIISFNYINITGGSITSPYAISTDRWYHIAVTFDGGIYKLYIDGIEVVSKNGQALNDTSGSNYDCMLGAMDDVDNTTPYSNAANHFNGWMDEFRVWNKALTPEQLHIMMNQEIEETGIDEVKGVTLPIKINGLSWSDLGGYYKMDAACGFLTTSKGAIHGKLRNINNNLEETAPVPYTSANNGDWDTMSAWTQPVVWDAPNSVGVDGSTLIDWNIVETSHNITVNRDLTLLGLVSKAGEITVNGSTNPDGTGTGNMLWITHYLELDGVIDFEGESQFLQKRYTPDQESESILDADSGGYIERDQQGTANSFNYNYWSSTVGPISGDISARGSGIPSTNNSHSVVGFLQDGTTPSSPAALSYNWPYTWADAYSGFPKRLSSYWLYTFNGTSDDYWSWKSISENTPILAGEGYTMKGTSGSVSITTLQNYVFKGKPYNGDFTLPIAKDNDRLIGNPYPSAMDADEFIKDNIKATINGIAGRNTKNIFNGALYYWDHFGQINTHILREYVGGYATYTLMGGAKAISNDIRINNNNATGTKVPGQYIPLNQGFFVIAALDNDLSNTTTTVDGGDIVFKNSQRVFIKEGVGSSVFMKSTKAKTENVKSNDKQQDGRSKIWLMFDSPKGYHRQLLVGADENTTNNFDIGYDGLIADVGSEDMFWMIDEAKFVIQGVPNFNKDQEFPLGIKVAETGLVRIKIDELQNVDSNVQMYIKDNATLRFQKINNKPFELYLDSGEYLDRFSLVFSPRKESEVIFKDEKVMGVEVDVLEKNIQVFMSNETSEIKIIRAKEIELKSIGLYTILGQKVKYYNKNLNYPSITLPVNLAAGIYFVQINSTVGMISKKIVIE
ncbi:LamG-like jellyroll fold domain-containing protein, partial [Lutibacter agarilyticus]